MSDILKNNKHFPTPIAWKLTKQLNWESLKAVLANDYMTSVSRLQKHTAQTFTVITDGVTKALQPYPGYWNDKIHHVTIMNQLVRKEVDYQRSRLSLAYYLQLNVIKTAQENMENNKDLWNALQKLPNNQ